MWTKTYSKTVRGLKSEKLWQAWTDINRWHNWQSDIDYAKLEGEFAVGNQFVLKPKGGPRVKIELVEVAPNRSFTDLTKFPLARMYGQHEFVETTDGVEIRTTMRIDGPLAFLWRKLVAEGIVAGLPAQTDSLIEYASRSPL